MSNTQIPRSFTRFGAGAGALALAVVFLPTGSAAAAVADGDVDVVNTETVQVYTDAVGNVQAKRIYEQLTLAGRGTAKLDNPVEESGLRNLDGFSGFDVSEGTQHVETEVDGVERRRTVSDYDGELPLDVEVVYELDGEQVEPGDVVGESGDLDVTYTVKNVTGDSREISYPDGQGGTITETVDVSLPMVGSLTTNLPANFTEVKSEQANMAGDGRGGTKLSFTMTLVPPIGSDTATFGYTATVTDGLVPRASLSALPVNPLESPTFKTAASSYEGGATTGAELTAGATEIDANLLRIRDGAGDLLAGLLKLHEGSQELQSGLRDRAAPGAEELADGAGELEDGLGRIDDGAGRLARGAGDLQDGLGRIDDGAGLVAGGTTEARDGAELLDGFMGQLAGGQQSLVEGLRLLESGVDVLPQTVRDQLGANAQYQALLAGMQKVVDGIGQPTDVTNPATGLPATMFGGLNAIRGGLTGLVKPGLQDALATIPDSRNGLNCAALILTDLVGGSDAPGVCFPGGVRPPLDDVLHPVNALVLGSMADQLGAGASSLTELETGLSRIVGAIDHQFVPGIDRLKLGLLNPQANPNCAVGAATTADPRDDCGIQQAVGFFRASIPTLVDGITTSIRGTLLEGISVPADGCSATTPTLLCGAMALADGGSALAEGTTELSAGLGDLEAGSHALADGTSEARDGSGRLADGASELAAGADKAHAGSGLLSGGALELAEGLMDAADGSRRLTDGLGQAAGAAPKLPQGAERLSEEGMSKLIAAGKATAAQYGKLYAIVGAGSERAQTDAMAIGKPDDARGLTAYSFEIKGEDGEGERNVARVLSGVAMAGLGLGAFALRRRLI